MRIKSLVLLTSIYFFAFLISNSSADILKDEAAKLFDQSKKSVFQVRVINLSTNEKSSTGSGFFIERNGYAVTNYHVVSDYVDKPSEHKIQIINSDGDVLDLNLVNFDIVHDLAVLTAAQAHEAALPLGHSDPMGKGERIFSMGNPKDLGMTIIEGTFNGVMEQSMERRIIFSGSLNPGMSGGPAFNHLGEVIGINVSTMENDVSFLVPVEYLTGLLDKDAAKSSPVSADGLWDHLIEGQLMENQAKSLDAYLAHGWKQSDIGDYKVPGEITPYVKCWGNSKDEKEDLLIKSSTNCSSDDYIYINDEFYSAQISYLFYWHKSKNLHFLRLYDHLQKDLDNLTYMENSRKEDVERFNCETNFVLIDNRVFKSSVCSRQYKRYKKLYDINLSLATVDEFNSSLIGNVTLLGVTKEKGMQFLEQFMKAIRWKK